MTPALAMLLGFVIGIVAMVVAAYVFLWGHGVTAVTVRGPEEARETTKC